MIDWYKSDKLAIYFNSVPHVCIRYILPSSTAEEIKSIKKFPFMCKTQLEVTLVDYNKNKNYKFTIPKGYCYDGASIPRIFWRLIGSNTDNAFLIPALIHDVLCENHRYIDNDRAFSTEVFGALLEVSEVGFLKRLLMKTGVNIWQSLFADWGLEYNK